jgi:hypothetical protein
VRKEDVESRVNRIVLIGSHATCFASNDCSSWSCISRTGGKEEMQERKLHKNAPIYKRAAQTTSLQVSIKNE